MLITNASRLGDFFVIFFFVPKVVPKVYYQELLVSSIICCKGSISKQLKVLNVENKVQIYISFELLLAKIVFIRELSNPMKDKMQQISNNRKFFACFIKSHPSNRFGFLSHKTK